MITSSTAVVPIDPLTTGRPFENPRKTETKSSDSCHLFNTEKRTIPLVIVKEIGSFLNLNDLGSLNRLHKATKLTPETLALTLKLSTLQTVRTGHKRTWVNALTQKPQFFPALLSLCYAGMRGQELTKLLIALPKLETLVVKNMFLKLDFLPYANCRILKSLSLRTLPIELISILRMCTALTSLDVSIVDQQNLDMNEVFFQVGTMISKIEHLSLKNIRWDYLSSLAAGMKENKEEKKSNLKSLVTSSAYKDYYKHLTSFLTVGHPHLKKMYIDAYISQDELIKLVKRLPKDFEEFSCRRYEGTLKGLQHLKGIKKCHFKEVESATYTKEQFVAAMEALSPKPKYSVGKYRTLSS